MLSFVYMLKKQIISGPRAGKICVFMFPAGGDFFGSFSL